MPRSEFEVLSLFSGCGGLDLGLASVGVGPHNSLDFDAHALANLRRNLGSETSVLDLARGVPDGFSAKDVLVAGPPCQGFSTLGRMRPDDPRNELLLVPARAAERLRPRFVVIENVSGAASPRFQTVFDKADEILRTSGYTVRTIPIEMTAFGVPQVRKRMLKVAWLGGGEFRFPDDVADSTKPTIRTALANVEGAPNHSPLLLDNKTAAGQIAQKIGPGQKLCNVRSGDSAVRTWAVPAVFGDTTSRERAVLEATVRLRRRNRKREFGDADPVLVSDISTFTGFPAQDLVRGLISRGHMRNVGRRVDLTRTFNGKFRRLEADGVAPAVDTRFCDARYALHPTENRGFTLREAARIQGFPDTYTFEEGTSRDHIRYVGNAVPPPAGAAIGEAIRKFLVDQ